MNNWNWDEYFINACYLAAKKSKDSSTQVGAVIVGPDQEVRATGYNGPPRGFNDEDATIYERPLKYAIFVHGEMNALLSAARIGVACKGCIMYVTFHPCSGCARSIVQAGIREVIYHKENPGSNQWSWKEDQAIAERIFRECGVSVREWSGIPEINGLLSSGVEIDYRAACV